MKGSGTIYRRKNARGEEAGPYWIQWWVDGKRHRESTETENKTEARRRLNLRVGDAAKGAPVAPRYDRLRFDQAIEQVVKDYRTNDKRSLDSLERRVKLHLLPYFGRLRMVAITTSTIRAYVEHRQKAGAARATINRELSAVRRAFSLAVQSGELLHRPHVPMLKEENTRTGFFTAEQVESVIAHLADDLKGIVEFAAETGWRIASEVLPLEWRQVDFDAGEVRLDPGTTKNGEGRVFPMTSRLRSTLEKQLAASKRRQRERGVIDRKVFTRDGAPILDFRKAFTAACKAAGCPGRVPHDLRRTAVRRMVRAGVTPQIAMALVGHKTASMLWRYNITATGDLTDAALKLDAEANRHSSATDRPTGTEVK